MIDYDVIKEKYYKLSNINSTIIIKRSKYVPKEIYSIFKKNLSVSKFCGKTSYKFLLKKNSYIYISTPLSSIKYHIVYNNESNINISTIIESYKTSIILNDVFKINKKFNIYILMSDNKRFLPISHDHIIDAEHINGGFTDLNTENIFITRGEEFSKVIMHEILHHSYIDNKKWDMDNISKLKKTFNIANDTYIYPNEAVIELHATILKLFFVSLRYNISFKKICESELRYSMIQYFKIKNKQKYMQKWRENTNAYCYIIFKTILFKNYNKLIDNFYYNVDYITEFLISNKIELSTNTNIKFNKSLKIMKYSNY